MTALDKMKDWLTRFPEYDALTEFQVDYTDKIPSNGGIFPNGLVEISRVTDIFGNVTITNQYNFGLYYVFEKAPGEESTAKLNADWVSYLQEWVQEQSATRNAPTFGDVPYREKITAQNGTLYAADEEGTATYMVQISVQFIKKYEVKNEWLT